MVKVAVPAAASGPVRNSNKKTNKINKKPKTSVSHKSVTSTIHKKKEKVKEKISGNGSEGSLDEKGNPLPTDDPKGGGDPICPGGYKIDYDFDPFNDPINPPFRCISALKDPSDGPTTNIINKLNNPASNITDLASVTAPAAGGGRSAKRIRRRMRKRKITQRQKNKLLIFIDVITIAISFAVCHSKTRYHNHHPPYPIEPS